MTYIYIYILFMFIFKIGLLALFFFPESYFIPLTGGIQFIEYSTVAGQS